MKRDCNGFTLTEILVVSVIIAVLSAVAVPVYTNFVKEQRKEAVVNLAKAAAVSANIFYRRTGTTPCTDLGADCPAILNLFLPEEGRYTVTVDPTEKTVTVQDNDFEEAIAEVPFR